MREKKGHGLVEQVGLSSLSSPDRAARLVTAVIIMAGRLNGSRYARCRIVARRRNMHAYQAAAGNNKRPSPRKESSMLQ